MICAIKPKYTSIKTIPDSKHVDKCGDVSRLHVTCHDTFYAKEATRRVHFPTQQTLYHDSSRCSIVINRSNRSSNSSSILVLFSSIVPITIIIVLIEQRIYDT